MQKYSIYKATNCTNSSCFCYTAVIDQVMPNHTKIQGTEDINKAFQWAEQESHGSHSCMCKWEAKEMI